MTKIGVGLLVALALALLFWVSRVRHDDRDCSDFDSQAAAQTYYLEQEGDSDWLDADHDGVACELLP